MSIPRSPVVAPIEYLEDRLPLWEADPAVVGLSPEQVTAASILVQAARDAYSAQQAAELAASNALTSRDDAIAAMRTFCANLIAAIRAFARAENDPSVYAAAGLLPPADPTPSPDPVAPTDLAATLVTQGAINVSWEGTLALGTFYEVQRTLDNASTWATVDSVATRSVRDEGVPAGTPSAGYRVRAKRPSAGVGKAGTDTRVSDWTQTVMIPLGKQGNQPAAQQAAQQAGQQGQGSGAA
jgi:hypothetical protein